MRSAASPRVGTAQALKSTGARLRLALLPAHPQELRESMMSHLKLHFNNQERNDEKVLNAYPSIIQRRVRRFLYLDILHASMLFSGARQRFLDALLSAARVEAYLPNVSLTDGLCSRIKGSLRALALQAS